MALVFPSFGGVEGFRLTGAREDSGSFMDFLGMAALIPYQKALRAKVEELGICGKKRNRDNIHGSVMP